jgi:hypothetical protein
MARRCRARSCLPKWPQPDGAYYRAGQNQLIPNLYVGNAQAQGRRPTTCSR